MPWRPPFPPARLALDGFLGAGYALHIVAAMRMLSEPRDIGRAVGDGNANWFATVDVGGRGRLRDADGDALEPDQLQQFTPTLFLYDNYPGGIGISAPLFESRATIVTDSPATDQACACAYGCPSCIGPILARRRAARTLAETGGARRIGSVVRVMRLKSRLSHCYSRRPEVDSARPAPVPPLPTCRNDWPSCSPERAQLQTNSGRSRLSEQALARRARRRSDRRGRNPYPAADSRYPVVAARLSLIP